MSTRRKYQKVVVDGSVAYIYVQSKTHGEKIIAIDTPDLSIVGVSTKGKIAGHFMRNPA